MRFFEEECFYTSGFCTVFGQFVFGKVLLA